MAASAPTFEAHKIEMGREVLRAGGSFRLRVLGMSMLPSIWPGDIVTIESDSQDAIVTGAIFLFAREGKFVVHRLARKLESQNQIFWVSRGDAMPEDDPAWSQHDLVGRVSKVERKRRVFAPAGELSQFARAAGWILCHNSLLRNLVLRIHSFSVRQLQHPDLCRPSLRGTAR